MYEKEKQHSIEMFNKALDYVKNKMSAEAKDRIYKIGIGQIGWELKKETLSTKQYNKLRDEFIATSLTMDALGDEIAEYSSEYVKKFEKSYYRLETADHFSKNAIKAMETHFKDQTANILAVTGEAKLDYTKMKYVGNKTYVYNEMFIISFENSPAAVEIRYLVDY